MHAACQTLSLLRQSTNGTSSGRVIAVRRSVRALNYQTCSIESNPSRRPSFPRQPLLLSLSRKASARSNGSSH